MSTVSFKRGTNTDMTNTPITDGMVFFNTSDYKVYMDNGNTRLQYGGDTTLISNPAQATVTNAFNSNASLQLFLQKTTVVDTKAAALAVTQSYIPLGCLAFKEAIGTTDYSGVGNGTISNGLVTLNNGVVALNNQLTANNHLIYMDYKNGMYGYNTNANRGADTFHPFNSLKTTTLVSSQVNYPSEGTYNLNHTVTDNGYYILFTCAHASNGSHLINSVTGFSEIDFDSGNESGNRIEIFDAAGSTRIVIGYAEANSTINVNMTVTGSNRSGTFYLLKV